MRRPALRFEADFEDSAYGWRLSAREPLGGYDVSSCGLHWRLTPLRAAASAADDFGLWLEKRQEFDDVRVLTDRDPQKLVTAKMVKDVVRDLLDSGPTQLVGYFSCHGLLNGQSEIWLLSRASEDPDEAIDLTASRERSRLCRVPNVVFISDACRALPADLPTSSLGGISILPLAQDLAGVGKRD